MNKNTHPCRFCLFRECLFLCIVSFVRQNPGLGVFSPLCIHSFSFSHSNFSDRQLLLDLGWSANLKCHHLTLDSPPPVQQQLVVEKHTNHAFVGFCKLQSTRHPSEAHCDLALSKTACSCSLVVASFCCIRSVWPLVTPQLSGLDNKGQKGRPEAGFRFSQ